MKEKILITGGSGFIGSNYIQYLDPQKWNILNIDISPPLHQDQTGYWQNTDLCDAEALESAIFQFQPDYIIHLAARTDLDGSSLKNYSVNFDGVSNLISVCKKVVSIKKIVFASSMLVCKVGYLPKTETDYQPDTIYGQSKAEMEIIIRDTPMPFQWTIVRPTSIWGPGFKEPYRNFFDMVRKGRFIDLNSKYCSKTYGYIGNTVYQIYQILHSPETDRKVYYLGDDPPIPISEWGAEIALEMGKAKPSTIPFFLMRSAAWLGDILKLAGIRFPLTSFRLKNMTTNNIIDLKDLYDIAPTPPYSRIQGVKETINWLNNNREIH